MNQRAYFKIPFLILAFLTGVALRSFFDIPNYLVFGLLGFMLALFVFLALNPLFGGSDAHSKYEQRSPEPKAQSFQDLAQSRHGGTSREIFQQKNMRVLGNFGAEVKGAMLCLLIFFFLLGILRFSYFENNIAKDELHLHYDEVMNLSGMVISAKLTENSQRIVVSTDLGRILVTKRIYPQYKYGDTLEIKGKILEPEDFGNFDVKKYLAKSEIYAEMVFPEVSDLTKTQTLFGTKAKSALFFIKDKFEENLRNILPEPHASLADGMLLGNQGVLDKDLIDDFRKSGTIHILVLSGYNITIVGVFVMAFFGFIVSETAAWSLAIFAILAFTLMSGAEAAAVRSAVMAIIGLLALKSGRKNIALLALIWAAFLMVLWNPMLMRFDRGFQLSFLATLGLIVASPFFKKFFWFLPKAFGLRENASSSFAAQIFVMPLLLSWGGAISWFSPLVNILVLWAVPAVMLFSFLGAISAFASVFLGKIIASAAYLLISYQIYFVKFFGSLSFSMIQFSFLPFFLLASVYACLFYWAYKHYAKVF
ncbi:MAG: ComEC/Rec2 family competence protein [bacterium]|nr:ComEC/Rec2 family competence protein [bacterium]